MYCCILEYQSGKKQKEKGKKKKGLEFNSQIFLPINQSIVEFLKKLRTICLLEFHESMHALFKLTV